MQQKLINFVFILEMCFFLSQEHMDTGTNWISELIRMLCCLVDFTAELGFAPRPRHGSFVPSGRACRCYLWTSEQEFPDGRWKHEGGVD
jgi:hypothetical protein